MTLKPREQDAIDGLKFCLEHGKPPFLMDVRIALRILDKMTKSGELRPPMLLNQ